MLSRRYRRVDGVVTRNEHSRLILSAEGARCRLWDRLCGGCGFRGRLEGGGNRRNRGRGGDAQSRIVSDGRA